jgi:hypothetical protein
MGGPSRDGCDLAGIRMATGGWRRASWACWRMLLKPPAQTDLAWEFSLLLLSFVMSNPFFTITPVSGEHEGPKVVGRFFTSDQASLSVFERGLVCQQLNLTSDEGLLFEPTGWSLSDELIGRACDFTTETGRKFWVYGLNDLLPAEPGT